MLVSIKRLGACLLSASLVMSVLPGYTQNKPAGTPWPAVVKENKPWTRWWWMGSAVDKENLSRLLKIYADAGLGGVEIVPIYGAKGYEAQYLKYLSPDWFTMIDY